MKKLIAALALLGVASVSHAAQFCVAGATALHSALLTAAASPEDDEIRVRALTIAVTADLATPNQVHGALSLRGGYDVGCAQRASNAKSTLVSDLRRLQLFLDDHGLLIERIDFSGFREVHVTGNMANALDGTIRINRSAFRNGRDGLVVESWGFDVQIENSLFTGNGDASYGAGLSVRGLRNVAHTSAIRIVNTTVVDNRLGVHVLPEFPANPGPVIELSNVISHGNALGDLLLEREVLLRYSTIGVIDWIGAGALHERSSGNLGIDPQLNASYRPLPGSHVIDSGTDAAFPGGTLFFATDYAGSIRKVGARVDRGAFEYSGSP